MLGSGTGMRDRVEGTEAKDRLRTPFEKETVGGFEGGEGAGGEYCY